MLCHFDCLYCKRWFATIQLIHNDDKLLFRSGNRCPQIRLEALIQLQLFLVGFQWINVDFIERSLRVVNDLCDNIAKRISENTISDCF